MEEQKQRPWFFNLNNDGDSAIVRLLHSSIDTIEVVDTHRVEVDGKKKRLKCLGEKCPMCLSGASVDKRIFIHLYDYTDGKEKVWDRTDKILVELKKVQEAWGPLNTAVVKITRKGNEFPRYEVVTLNPAQYEDASTLGVDTPIAKYYYLNRSIEEVTQYASTGKFPERPKFIPKDEYFKMKEAEKATTSTQPSQPTQVVQPTQDVFDPFMPNTFSTPRKI